MMTHFKFRWLELAGIVFTATTGCIEPTAPVEDYETRRAEVAPEVIDTKSAVLSGIVKDSLSRVPLGYATVELFGSNKKVVTSSNGYFEFSGLQGGTYTVRIRGIGYLLRDQANIQVYANAQNFTTVIMSYPLKLISCYTS